MSSSLFAVLTTIQAPSPSVRRLAEKVAAVGATLIVAGDKKGPAKFKMPGVRFITFDEQSRSPFQLGQKLPPNNYARKNMAYLAAIQEKAQCIYETDDDNAPNDNWMPRVRVTRARTFAGRPWVNVYRMFTDEHIWPRGLPLERITDESTYRNAQFTQEQPVDAPIQQGLADLSPDVDAIWRLVLDRPFRFKREPSVLVPAGTWSPFNSQSTWWWPPAYPLLYLPSYCTMRMTDIWRSFVAQRCLWAMGFGVVFHAAEVDQQRNQHNLLRDMEDEIPGYRQNQQVVESLAGLSLENGEGSASENLLRCYEGLIRINVLPQKELTLLNAWVTDLGQGRKELVAGASS